MVGTNYHKDNMPSYLTHSKFDLKQHIFLPQFAFNFYVSGVRAILPQDNQGSNSNQIHGHRAPFCLATIRG